MKLKYIPIFIIFIIVYGLLNYYVGKTTYKYLNNYVPVNPLCFWIFISTVALSYPLSMIISGFSANSLTDLLQVIGSYWMAYFMYSLILFPILYIINFSLSKFNFYTNLQSKLVFIETIFILLFFAINGVLGYINAHSSYVNTIELNTADVSFEKPLNIVMVSDIHLGAIIENDRLSTMIDEINVLNPDVVLIAGDIIDTNIEPFLRNNMAKEFSKIKSKYGTFATLGNHDLMTSETDKILSELNENNVTVLRDEAILIDNSFYIIGRDDASINNMDSKRKSLETIVSTLDNSLPKIVIDHTPTSLDESLAVNANLHFSGHTHSGQLMPANLITKRIFEIDHGYLNKENLHVVVSSGYGTWGPPLRIGSKSEIINVIIDNH